MTKFDYMAQKCSEFSEQLSSDIMCFDISKKDHDVYESLPSSFQLPHLHDSWELKLIIGPTPLSLPEKNAEMIPPGLIIVPPNMTHTGTKLDKVNGNRMLAIVKERDYLVLAYVGKNSCSIVLDQTQLDCLTELAFAAPDKICTQLHSSVQVKKTPSCKLYIVNLLRFYLAALGRMLAPPGCAAQARVVPENNAVVRAVQYITAYYYRPTLTVNDVAEHVGLTPGHLSVLFKKQKTTTIRKQIIQARLEKGKELLLTGRYIIKEVSCLTGWNDQLYFSKCFRKYYGCSPREIKTTIC